jgi:hypothetical protein
LPVEVGEELVVLVGDGDGTVARSSPFELAEALGHREGALEHAPPGIRVGRLGALEREP